MSDATTFFRMRMRSEEIYVSSGQYTSITFLGLAQKKKAIFFSIF